MQDKNLEEYKNPTLRNKRYINFCDEKANNNNTENGTYRNNNGNNSNLFDMEMENYLNSIRSSFYDDFNNNIYNNYN